MQTNDNNEFYQASRRETLTTLLVSGLTLAVLLTAGYLTPGLLAFAGH